MNVYLRPLVWNRTLIAWVDLLFAILLIILGLNISNAFSTINFILAGFLIGLFFSDGFINKLHKLNLDSIKLNRKIMQSSERFNSFQCCLCGDTCLGYGNNPEPVFDIGRCCDKCNLEKVIPARRKYTQEYS